MYRVTINNGGEKTVIHDDLRRVYGGTLTEEVNAIPSFDFELLPNSGAWNKIEPLYTGVTIHDNDSGKDIFNGRVISVSPAMDSGGNLRKSVKCEGLLGWLNDSVQTFSAVTSELSTSVFQKILDEHNAMCGADKKIILGECELAGLYEVIEETENATSFDTLLKVAESDWGDGKGFEFRLRENGGKKYLDLARQFGSFSDVPIKLGINMKSVTVTDNMSDFCTRLYPYGDKSNSGIRLTVAPTSQTQGQPYIDVTDSKVQEIAKAANRNFDGTALLNKYGLICKTEIFDGISGSGETAHDGAVKLYNAAVKSLAARVKISRRVEVTALDLSKNNKNFNEYEIGNTYRIQHSLLGIDEQMRLVKRQIYLDKPYESKIAFGDAAVTLTGTSARSAKRLNKK